MFRCPYLNPSFCGSDETRLLGTNPMQMTFFGRDRAQSSGSIWFDVLLFRIRRALERVPDKPTVPEGLVALIVYGLFK